MKISSAKAKGRNLQKTVAWHLQIVFQLSDNDVRSTPMGTSGSDLMLSDKALSVFPYDVECKNQQKLNVWDAYAQSATRAKDVRNGKGLEPLAVIKKNGQKPLAVVDLEHFMWLARCASCISQETK